MCGVGVIVRKTERKKNARTHTECQFMQIYKFARLHIHSPCNVLYCKLYLFWFACVELCVEKVHSTQLHSTCYDLIKTWALGSYLQPCVSFTHESAICILLSNHQKKRAKTFFLATKTQKWDFFPPIFVMHINNFTWNPFVGSKSLILLW